MKTINFSKQAILPLLLLVSGVVYAQQPLLQFFRPKSRAQYIRTLQTGYHGI